MVMGDTLDTQETGETSENAPEQVSVDIEQLKKEAELAKNYKVRAEKAEAERKALENRLNNELKKSKNGLDVEDYIDISASLDGLDQREKEKLAQEHKLSGKTLKDIRESEDFSLWQSAYRAKVEKERLSLAPSTTQDEQDKPRSLTDRLRDASMADKEKILTEMGLYKTYRPRTDRVDIGRKDLR